MTAKRFTIQDGRVIKDNQKYVTENGYVLNYKSDAEEVCNLLNELYTKYVDEYALRETLQLELQRIEEENEQLKQFKEKVFAKIDMYLQLLPYLRDEDVTFQEEFADTSLYNGAIEVLETLKTELMKND